MTEKELINIILCTLEKPAECEYKNETIEKHKDNYRDTNFFVCSRSFVLRGGIDCPYRKSAELIITESY